MASGSCAGSTSAARLLAAALLLAAVGCRGKREADESSAILSAFEAFQNAVDRDRRPALEALAHARCGDASLCADRDACARYGEAVVRARELTDKAKSFAPVDAGGSGAATRDELAIIVAGAEEAVGEAEQAEPLCLAAVQRLVDRRAKAR